MGNDLQSMEDVESDRPARLGIGTLGGFLAGRRNAILTAASCPWAIPLGAFFVLAAGLAREYDGVSLRDEPWHLLIPFGASLAAATLLYGLLFLTSWLRQQHPRGFWRGWFRFLGLFWLTAPMALLYGIPYERFLPELDAVRANLLTLGVVALWRVALMSRIVSVLWQWGPVSSAFVTMVFADGVAVLALSQAQVPVMPMMGGIRYSEAEALLAEVGLAAQAIAWILVLPLLLAYIVVGTLYVSSPVILNKRSTGTGLTPAIVVLAIAACLVWIPGMFRAQREQQLRHRVESMLFKGQIVEALGEMSSHQPEDFPPNWTPPPRVELRTRQEIPLERVFLTLATMQPPAAGWVEREMARKANMVFDPFSLTEFTPGEFENYLAWLRRIPEGPKIAARHLRFSSYSGLGVEESEWLKSALDRLKAMIVERGKDLEDLNSRMQ